MEELKEQLQQGTFYYHKSNLFTDNVKPVKRPPNIVKKFEWFHMLKNEYYEIIGYIGKVVS